MLVPKMCPGVSSVNLEYDKDAFPLVATVFVAGHGFGDGFQPLIVPPAVAALPHGCWATV